MGRMPGSAVSLFDLDPSFAHLNHGGFGAVPCAVTEAAQRWRTESERNPHHFNRTVVHDEIAKARSVAAGFLHLAADEAALVRNVSEGVSTVLASLDLCDGDEIVLGAMVYGSVRIAVDHWCRRTGARVVEVPVALAATDAEITEAFSAATTARTRLVVVDQITSPTGMALPVADVSAAVRGANPDTAVLVDAAHVPGHIDTDPSALGADFWVGNFHKWAFAVRGTAALWASPRWRVALQPLVLSWATDEPFPVRFDHPGTLDYSGWLSLPAALEFFDRVGGWQQVRRNAELVRLGQQLVADRLGTGTEGLPRHPAPAMRLVRLPDGMLTSLSDVEILVRRLRVEHRVEAAPIWFDGQGYVRIGAQVYNSPDDYLRLAEALRAISR